MKEKDIIKGKELERVNNELFGSFDPEDESWIGAGTPTLTASTTFTPTGTDAQADIDWSFKEIETLNQQ